MLWTILAVLLIHLILVVALAVAAFQFLGGRRNRA
jgi:hypothetical protein